MGGEFEREAEGQRLGGRLDREHRLGVELRLRPDAAVAGHQPARAVPEVVAHGRVLAGSNASGGKQATAAHRFGVLSTYDGHRAKVGRVVCDSTWHHFVNVNLIGVVEGGGFDEFDTHPGEDASKHNGFLSSASGIAALAKIRNYYTNVGIWIAPPARQACFARQVWWQLVYADRVMEAALADPATPLAKIPADVLYAIGVHARDAFGQRASQCQSLEWALGLADLVMPELRRWIDPWDPITVADAKEAVQLPLVDPMPLLDTALGAALVALRQAAPYPPEKISDELDKLAQDTVARGARAGLVLAIEQYNSQSKAFAKALKGL